MNKSLEMNKSEPIELLQHIAIMGNATLEHMQRWVE